MILLLNMQWESKRKKPPYSLRGSLTDFQSCKTDIFVVFLFKEAADFCLLALKQSQLAVKIRSQSNLVSEANDNLMVSIKGGTEDA